MNSAVYADVVRPGFVTIGDAITLMRPDGGSILRLRRSAVLNRIGIGGSPRAIVAPTAVGSLRYPRWHAGLGERHPCRPGCSER
jgi:hypothetical protein